MHLAKKYLGRNKRREVDKTQTKSPIIGGDGVMNRIGENPVT